MAIPKAYGDGTGRVAIHPEARHTSHMIQVGTWQARRGRQVRIVALIIGAGACLAALALHACGGLTGSGSRASANGGGNAPDAAGTQLPTGGSHGGQGEGGASPSSGEAGSSSLSPAGASGSSALCPSVTGQYGGCAVVLGWGFDGSRCRQYSGCACAPDCRRLYPNVRECALACRANGYCNTDALVGTGIAADLVVGQGCGFTICVPEGLETELGLDLVGDCQVQSSCPGALTCRLASGTVDETLWDRLCTASIIPGVEVQCFKSSQ